MCTHLQTSGREMLTVMDDNGSMWQISIDGSKIKVVNSAPTQVSRMHTIRSPLKVGEGVFNYVHALIAGNNVYVSAAC